MKQSKKLIGLKPIHVEDREADSYTFMADLVRLKARFVLRMVSQRRKIEGEFDTVGEALIHSKILAVRDVPISMRARSTLPGKRKLHPPRNARTAHLMIAATRVTVLRPCSSNLCPRKKLTLNVVRVFEPDPPAGEEPVEWRLWTTEPITTETNVLAIIDAYRRRWVIEEFFKALKSGCAIEKRQLETRQALLNALAIFTPIAWRLLVLRTTAREPSDVPADAVLSKTQLRCLDFALKKKNHPGLPTSPTARDALLGVADLGGHIKNNGDPGWIVLGRGMDKLLQIEFGYLLATEM